MLNIVSALSELIDLKYKVDGDGIRDPYVNRYWQIESCEDGAVTIKDSGGQVLVEECNSTEADHAIKSMTGR